jgi:hypothetical protein
MSTKTTNVGRRLRRGLTAGGVVGTVGIVMGVLASSTSSHASTASVTPAPAAQSTTVVDPSDGLTFSPPSQDSSSAPAMNADQAWATYAETAVGKSEPVVPQGLSVQLGGVSLPVSTSDSSMGYVFQNELAYAYTMDDVACAAPSIEAEQSMTKSCREWTFVDANTGVHIFTVFRPMAAPSTPAKASASASAKCPAPSRGAKTHRLQLRRGAHDARTVVVQRRSIVVVKAKLRGYRMATPHAFTHRAAVCKLSVHRGHGGAVSARFEAVHAARVRFGSVAESRSGPPNPLTLGYAKIVHKH